MRVRYSETALHEANEILAYIATRNTSAAKSVATRIEELLQLLSESPYMAQETEVPGVRKLPLSKFPYLIFYTIEGDEVVILHVRHGARLPPWTED